MKAAASVLLALLAGLAFAVATVLQWREARRVPVRHSKMLARIVTKPEFLASLAVDGLGVGLQGAAVGLGRVVLVQPLLITGLLFAVPLAKRIDKQPMTRRDQLGAGLCVIGLGGFLLLAQPAAGVSRLIGARGVVVPVGLTVASLALALIGYVAAARFRPLLALGAGGLLGTAGAVLKVVLHGLSVSGFGELGTWQLWLVVLAAPVGLVLVQMAFQTPELAAPLAILTMTEPMVGVAIGALGLDETIRFGAAVGAGEVAFVIAAAAGVVLLAYGAGTARDHVPAGALTPLSNNHGTVGAIGPITATPPVQGE